jgi:hypothetical protein
MNWLGLTPQTFLGALLGALLGSALFAWASTHGVDAPYLVGPCTGFGAMAAAPDRSVLRGIFIAALALWASAITQSLVGPYAGTKVIELSRTLTLVRGGMFVGGMLLGGMLGSCSLRKGANKRLSGT